MTPHAHRKISRRQSFFRSSPNKNMIIFITLTNVLPIPLSFQTDNCLKLPVESNLASSVKITSCTPGASDNIEVSVSVFNKDDCSSSFNFDPFVYTFDWPASCLNGTKLSCQVSYVLLYGISLIISSLSFVHLSSVLLILYVFFSFS